MACRMVQKSTTFDDQIRPLRTTARYIVFLEFTTTFTSSVIHTTSIMASTKKPKTRVKSKKNYEDIREDFLQKTSVVVRNSQAKI